MHAFAELISTAPYCALTGVLQDHTLIQQGLADFIGFGKFFGFFGINTLLNKVCNLLFR
jgi:hypothetical protein